MAKTDVHRLDILHATSARSNLLTALGLWLHAKILIYARRRKGRFPAEALRQESTQSRRLLLRLCGSARGVVLFARSSASDEVMPLYNDGGNPGLFALERRVGLPP